MFNLWFQKLGGSERTPDILVLTFKFVRSQKGSFDYENNYVNSASDNRTAFNVDRYIAVLGDLA